MDALTLAIARNAPIGVVIAAWSGKLSRMYEWDVERDVFTPGQFVKGRASVLAISPDGKYVAYYAEAHHRRFEAYVAVSHVPYFTAHALFMQHHLSWRAAHFASHKKLRLLAADYNPIVARYDDVVERIDPGCPFKIIRYGWTELHKRGITIEHHNRSCVEDDARERQVARQGSELVEVMRNGQSRTIVAFPKEKFEEIVAPEWAQTW
ncbi:MAG: hypothetical protein K1X67_04545 [Fimbriimonadaceae bacterium]|nr:hypothetical protein [Fimbriimonadaceae bacterium]